MAEIRTLVQSNLLSPADLSAALAQTEATRAQPGCLQSELFRSIEFDENVARLEIWESETAFDANSDRVAALGGNEGLSLGAVSRLAAPYHAGVNAAPRRHGENGVEFYPLVHFSRVDDVFVRAAPDARLRTARWPARGPVRIVIQSLFAEGTETAKIENAIATRREPGCRQFEQFRGVDFPENGLLLELWSGPEIYDIHYMLRIEDRLFGPPVPPPMPVTGVERRHGRGGLEWYQHCWYALSGDVWEPELPGERMSTVRW